MSRAQFSIRALLWLTLVVGILCAVGPPIWRYFSRPQLRYTVASEFKVTIWSDGTSTRRQLSVDEKERLKLRASRSRFRGMPLGR
jgi:hypothetical protein